MEEAQPPRERRSASRYAVDTESSLVIVNDRRALRALMFELGLDGCRVRTDRSLPVDANAGVELTFKINGISFRLAGTIQGLDARQTAAIRFSSMAPRRREALEYLLDELEAQKQAEERAKKLAQAAGNSARSAPRLSSATAHPAATGIARILPMPAGLPADQSPSIAPAPAAPCAARPIGRERREQERHAVDKRATVFFIDVRAQISGRILDLSRCGCRIRTDERFPVGIYRRVETEFKVDGMPFRLAGVIQALHDKFTVGLRFLDMSPRKRQQLQELMQEIAEMEAAGNRYHGSDSSDPATANQEL